MAKRDQPKVVNFKQCSLFLLGPLLFGLSVGIQTTITAFLLWGPASAPGLADQLTEYGKKTVRPEHDLLIYVAGAVFTVLMAWLAVWHWRRKLAAVEPSRASEFMTAAGLWEGALAELSVLAYAVLLCFGPFSANPEQGTSLRPPIGAFDAARLLVPCAVALVLATIDLGRGLSQPVARANKSGHWRLPLDKILRYATPVFIILVIGVPLDRWRYLGGHFFAKELRHHVNFFVMGPALSFAHGKAFGTEIFSQYGIGWPLLASMLSPFSALTYGKLAGMEILYGCVYYGALFFLLRTCFRQEVWAAFAVVLAIYWQIFSGISPGDVMWTYPSSTMMRHPLDVWFFFALVLHQRGAKTWWAAIAGVAAGLGVFFGTETGAYLIVTFFIYSVLRAGLATDQGRPKGRKEFVLSLAVFSAAAAATLLPLLLYASRGTFFTRAFWGGWLQALVMYGATGVGALPIAELPDFALLLFAAMVSVYLGVIAYAVVQGWHGRASSGEVLMATLASYGLAVLLLFVGRSHPFNLCHTTPPFAVLLTALILRCYHALPRLLQRSGFAYALLAGIVLLLLTKPQFRSYPSLLGSAFQSSPSPGVSLRTNPPDICGLPPVYEGSARLVQALCSTIRTLAPDGKGVAILDLTDTMLYSVAEACPWSRYTSLFRMGMTQQSLQDMRNELIARSPKYAVIRAPSAPRPAEWEFVWAPLYATVTNRYVLQQTLGPFEVWRDSQQP